MPLKGDFITCGHQEEGTCHTCRAPGGNPGLAPEAGVKGKQARTFITMWQEAIGDVPSGQEVT